MSAVRLRYMLPLSLFVVLAVGIGLTLYPRQIPPVLIDEEVPQFSLGPVEGRPEPEAQC